METNVLRNRLGETYVPTDTERDQLNFLRAERKSIEDLYRLIWQRETALQIMGDKFWDGVRKTLGLTARYGLKYDYLQDKYVVVKDPNYREDLEESDQIGR